MYALVREHVRAGEERLRLVEFRPLRYQIAFADRLLAGELVEVIPDVLRVLAALNKGEDIYNLVIYHF